MPYCVHCCAPNEIDYGKINVETNSRTTVPTKLTSSSAGCIYQQRSKYRQVKITKHASKKNKLHLINQTGQSTTWIETCIKFKKYIECSFWANIHKIWWNFHSVSIISLYETISYSIVQTMSVVINDSSDVLCFDLYLINTTAKFTKEERCTDLTFKLTLYCSSVTVEDLNL